MNSKSGRINFLDKDESPWNWKQPKKNKNPKICLSTNCQKFATMDLSKFGPGFGAGAGCGVGLGVGLIDGFGYSNGQWNHLRPVFGIGFGCGVGAGFGYGQGVGYGRSFYMMLIHALGRVFNVSSSYL